MPSHRFSFRLSTVLWITTVVAILFAWAVDRHRIQTQMRLHEEQEVAKWRAETESVTRFLQEKVFSAASPQSNHPEINRALKDLEALQRSSQNNPKSAH